MCETGDTGETKIFLHVKHENHTYKFVSLCYKCFPFNQYLKN